MNWRFGMKITVLDRSSTWAGSLPGAVVLMVNYTEDMATTTTALVTTAQFLAQQEQYDANGNRIKDELIGGAIVLVALPSRIHDLIKNRIN